MGLLSGGERSWATADGPGWIENPPLCPEFDNEEEIGLGWGEETGDMELLYAAADEKGSSLAKWAREEEGAPAGYDSWASRIEGPSA